MLTFSFGHIRLLFLGGLVILLPGCKRAEYTPKSLTQLITPTHKQDTTGVTLHAKKLNKQEAHLLFDGRGSRLLSRRKTIYPYHISICNKGSGSVILDPQNISIPLANHQMVASRLYSHTTRRIVTPLLIGLVGTTASFFAAAYITIIGAIAVMPAVIKAGYATLGISGLFAAGSPVLSYYQGHYAISVNSAIDKDLHDKMLIEPVEIKPGQSLNKLIFISSKSRNQSFSIDLVDQNTKQRLSFDIEEGEQSCKK